jgi:Ca2+-binding RTX toxin-like protein
VTVSYGDPSVADDANAIQDVAGNDAVSLTAEAVTNTILPPTLAIAEAAGDITAIELSDGIQATVGLTSATQAGDTITITTNDGTTDFVTTYSVTAGDVVAGEADITLTGSAAFADGDYTSSAIITNAGGSDTNATNTVSFAIDAVNDAPEVQAAPTSLLGLIGVEALNLIDLKDQDLAASDPNGNLESVVIEFSSVLNLSLGAVTLSASTDLANELGLQFNVVNDPGLLNILASSSTMTITANGGGTIDNQVINEFLASVLFNEGPVSLGVLEATTITATDTDGASSSDSASSLASAGVLNTNVSVIEGTPGDDVQNGTAGSDRIYGYDGNDTLSGGDGHDLIRGGDGDDTLNGGDGNDLLIDGDGNDTLSGGDGNDLLVITDSVFAALDGGDGYDILQLESGFSLDLTGVINISNIEQIDLDTGDAGSTLTLTEAAVSNLTDVANELFISGEANDTVNLLGAEAMGTTSTDASGVVYDNYSFGVNQVSIDQDIQVFI